MTAVVHLAVRVLQLFSGWSGWSWAPVSEVLVKVTILLLTAFALVLVLRRASAAGRHLVWTLSLCAVLALPIFALAFPAWEVPVFPSAQSGIASEVTSIYRERSAEPPEDHLVPVAVVPSPAKPVWPGVLLVVWALGSLFCMARMVVGQSCVRSLAGRSRLCQSSQALSALKSDLQRLRISRAVELRTGAEIGIPFTRGFFRPAIFLPEEAGEWKGERLEFVLAHELAHVARHDCLTQIPAQVACALFWFHPLVWLAAFQMRKERERACDDMVLNLGHPAADYAEFLVMLCRSLRNITPAWSTGIAMAESSQLEVRMKALLDPKINHKPLAASRVLFAAVLTMALLVPAAVIHATAKNDTGSISGTVHDPSGAVVPDAGVTLTNTQSHEQVEIQTGEDGTFSFPGVQPGSYQLEISKPGFVRKRIPILELASSRRFNENISLDIGEVTQTVLVTGHRPAGTASKPQHAPRRIRVGGLVQAPKLIKKTHPVYPPSAEEQGIEGSVIMRAVIGTSGQILSLSPYNGADPALIKSAMDAVRQWHYQPTLLNGEPVEVATTITVVFRLDQ
ncbi:MAG TPA: M56 family metallopeptidase [Terriglobia bacterium]|nr:M56 family metallopeptidase [Terriglobia bacterium]